MTEVYIIYVWVVHILNNKKSDMLKFVNKTIRFQSIGDTMIKTIRVGDKIVYPHNGLFTINNNDPMLYWYKTFRPLNGGADINVASPSSWLSYVVCNPSDCTLVTHKSNTNRLVYNIPYLKPCRSGGVRWDCSVSYSNTSGVQRIVQMCSFYVTDSYVLSSSMAYCQFEFNPGNGVIRTSITLPYNVEPTYEISFPSISNYSDDTNCFAWPSGVSIKNIAYNAVLL